MSDSGLFVDTAGWIAMADLADPMHAATRQERDACLRGGSILVTTDYVLNETLTLIRSRLGLSAAVRWWAQIDASYRLQWEWIGPARAEQARRLFFATGDEDLSFTDCTSFVVMEELRLRRALTTDRNFAQAGFEVLPTT